MRSLFVAIVLALVAGSVEGQTVADSTLRSEDGTLVSFYAPAAVVFRRFGIDVELPIQGRPDWRDFRVENATVMAKLLSHPDGRPICVVNRIEIRHGWETVRRVRILGLWSNEASDRMGRPA